MRYLLEALCYSLFMAFVAYLSFRPQVRLLPDDMGIISVSVSHAGQRIAECRQLSQDELNKLPPNMRSVEECPRERHPVRIEILANGQEIYAASVPPSGLWSDGKSVAFDRMRLKAANYRLQVRLNDDGNTSSYNYTASRSVVLQPGQNLVIGFDERDRRFVFH